MNLLGPRWPSSLALVLIASLVGVGGAVAPSHAVPGPPSAAGDPTASNLTLSVDDGFSDLLVDEAHEQILVAQSQGPLLVADRRAALVRTLDEVSGAVDLVLAVDGASIWAALPAAQQIVRLDAASLTTEVYDVGAEEALCPRSLAPAGDVVWFASRCSSSEPATIAALDPANGTVTRDAARYGFKTVLAAHPRHPGVVFVGSGWNLQRREISTGAGGPVLGTPVEANVPRMPTIERMAFTGNGSRLLAGGQGDVVSFSPTALTRGPSYALDRSAGLTLLTVSPDDDVAVGSLEQVGFFRQGKQSGYRYFNTYESSFAQKWLGAEWGEDGLYAVVSVRRGTERTTELQVLPDPLALSSVAVRPKERRIVIGKEVRLEITLDTPSARTVQIYASVVGGPERLVATRQVPKRKLVFVDKPRANTTYRVVHPGDDSTEPAQARTKVSVKGSISLRAVRSVRRNYGVAYYHSGDTAVVEAKVQAAGSTCVVFKITVHKNGKYRPAGKTDCLQLDPRGRARLSLTSAKGLYYHPIAIQARTPATPLNAASASRGRRLFQVQFCPTFPCSY